MSLPVGWIIKSEQLPELYELLQYAKSYCNVEKRAGWTNGIRSEVWNNEIEKIEKWLSEIEGRWKK